MVMKDPKAMLWDAIEFAVKSHGFIARKYGNQGELPPPYIIHPLRVMRRTDTYCERMVSEFTEHTACIAMAVAVLHDVVEDVPDVTLDMIEERFSKDVRSGVYWLTNPSKEHLDLPRTLRKEMDHNHLKNAPTIWQVVKMFDRIDNLLDMKNAPSGFVLDLYIPESIKLLESIGSASEAIAEELRKAIQVVCKYHLLKRAGQQKKTSGSGDV